MTNARRSILCKGKKRLSLLSITMRSPLLFLLCAFMSLAFAAEVHMSGNRAPTSQFATHGKLLKPLLQSFMYLLTFSRCCIPITLSRPGHLRSGSRSLSTSRPITNARPQRKSLPRRNRFRKCQGFRAWRNEFPFRLGFILKRRSRLHQQRHHICVHAERR